MLLQNVITSTGEKPSRVFRENIRRGPGEVCTCLITPPLCPANTSPSSSDLGF
jgi:hypothetical protein